MAPIFGTKGLVYAGGGSPSIHLFEAKHWRFDIDTDLTEITAVGSRWKSYLPNPWKWEVTIDGILDTGDTTPFDLIQETLAYVNPTSYYPVAVIALYPNRLVTAHYYYGAFWPKLTVDVDLTKVSTFTLGGIGDGALYEF